MASKPIGALVLVGIGYRSLSLSPSAVGPVKALLLELDTRKVEALISPLIQGATAGIPIREHLEAFAAAQGLPL